MINPAQLLKLKSSWNIFSRNHPKFPKFLEAAQKTAVEDGTVIEIKVTSPSGRELNSNLKLKESDVALFQELSELFKS